jgi:phenylacetate-CoA ligase
MMALSRTPLETWVKAKIGWPAGRDLTRQVLTKYQLEKLRATLDYVKRRSSFYRRHFTTHSPGSVHGLQDLARWPLTTADDLRSDPLAFLCVSQSAVERVVTLPTRSAGDRPKRLFFSAADLELAVDFFHHGFSTLVAPQQRMLVLMPCRKPYSVGDLIFRGLARLGASVIAHGPMHSPETVVDAVLQNQIDCLVGVPSEMAALSRYPGAMRIPPGQLRSIWLGTQNTLRSAAEEIGRFWGCPVLQHYGAAEMCPGGGVQCTARHGFHLREADLFIEIVDPQTSRPVDAGTYGEVLVTTLTREAMPLVRYRTGHLAAIMREPCPCGSVLRRMTSICPNPPGTAIAERSLYQWTP